VQWEFTREEEFTATNSRHAMTIRLKTGVKRDGTIVAQDLEAIANTGAYGNLQRRWRSDDQLYGSCDRTFATHLAVQPVVLATVMQVKGSTPREVGAKMLICANGQSIGTIGGGAGEAKVYRYALEIVTSGVKTIVDINLSGHRVQDTQGICGSMMKV
jgi:hypothetical protein